MRETTCELGWSDHMYAVHDIKPLARLLEKRQSIVTSYFI